MDPNMEIRQGENEDQVSNSSEALQAKLGHSGDSQSSKISEVIKLGSLENVSMHSLFNVVGRILDESIVKKNENISQRIASLLNLLIQEIEHRVSKQADNLRQSNLYKSREDRYHSKIRVLETLATGTIEENEVLINKLQQLKIEKAAMEEQKKLQEQDLIELRNEKNGFESQILSLNEQLALAQKFYDRTMSEYEAKAEETEAKLNEKIVELENYLVDSRKKVKQLEDFTESKFMRWKIREHGYLSFMDSQSRSLKDLRMASESIKQEVSKIRNTYAEEFYHFGINLKGVIDAAQNYHTVLEENRKLYNEVQDLKGNIRVYCRIRPFLSGQNGKQTTIQYIGENGELVVTNPLKPGKDSHRLFKFNKVFAPTITQEEVFRDTQPLIRSVLDGYNVCIFAYGQTGSGKTYTMTGPNVTSVVDWGVNYRALNDLFTISQNRHSSISYEIGVQMVEIYNEQVRDLLRNEGIQKRLGIWSISQPNGLAVPDASLHPVKSTVDVLELMNTGLMNRAVGATALNERSSRSHSILTVHVRGTDLETNAILRGCLHLVDLAGSERVDRSEATGERLREAQHINKSLSALGDVIFALAQKSNHIPYRNSKLTQVLQSSLGGQAKTLMFVQLNPDVESYSETISTLKFAERVSGVELGAARTNKEGRGVRELMEQVASLKEDVAQKDGEIQRLQSGNTNGNSVQSRERFAGAKLSSDKAVAYDMNHSSESSYRQSQAGSHPSPDDVFKHHEEFRQSSLDVTVGGDNSFPENTGLKLDLVGDDDSEDKLSDISDGVSMGTETDGSINSIVDLTLFPENGKSSSSEGNEKSPAKLPRPTAKHVQAKPSHSSLSKSCSKIPSAKRAAPSSTSSATKPPRKWP